MTTQRDTLLELDDKLRHKDFKLRPVFKTEEELIEERNQIFELPRKNCMQIMPELKRLSAKGSQHRLHVLKKIMKRARYDDVDQHLSHVTHVDVSDAIVPEGEVSKRLYEDIFVQRDFDLYGKITTAAFVLKFISNNLLLLRCANEAKWKKVSISQIS